MGNSWQDAIEEKSKKFLAVSKEQIDYYLIHKEFSYIKKRSLSTVKFFPSLKFKKNFNINILKIVFGKRKEKSP